MNKYEPVSTPKMKNAFENLVYDSNAPYNPFMHLFMMIALIWGIGFTVFNDTESIQENTLYMLMLAQTGSIGVIVWGVTQLAVLILTAITVAFKQYKIGKYVSMGGYLLWAYAFTLLVPELYWLQIITLCVPQILFWSWFYTRMSRNQKTPNDDEPKTS